MPSIHIRSSRLLAVLCATGLAFGVAACGGGGSSDSPSDVALNFYKALADKDAGKACGYVSDSAKKTADSAGGCEKALDTVIARTKPALLAAFGTLEASNEKITGDTATVTLTPTARGYTNGKQEANLVKQDGDWKLQKFNAG
jgi:hypothetical protein